MAAAKVSVALLCAAALLLMAAEASHLKLGYYKKTCPGWENVVKYHVAKAIRANRGNGAALVRLIFHDCFVRVRTTRVRLIAQFASSV
jgi:peroxidase